MLVGISSLYLIANESLEIGKAITTIDNVIITLPADFKITDQGKTFVEMTNRNSDEKIHIVLIKEKNKSEELMKDNLQELKSENVIDIENSTKNITNLKVYTIDYKNLSSDTPVNYSVNYVDKLNKTFIITEYNHDKPSELEPLKDIISTLRLDFKVKSK